MNTNTTPLTIDLNVHGPAPSGSTASQTEATEAQTLLSKAARLGTYMRHAGSFMLILSALAFMLQRWGVIDHITRYFSFLGFTGVMTAAALICGLGVKEGKGARTLFAMVVALAPVHFAQLGALLFSVFGEIPAHTHYPAYLLWQAHSPGAALATVGVACLLLIPILFTGFSTLDRQLAGKLTVVSLLANAVLLIPNRDPNTVALLGIVALVALSLYNSRLVAITRFATFENKIARATLFLPVAVLVVRQCVLYSLSAGFLAVSLMMIGAILFVSIPKYVSERIGTFSQAISPFPILAGWALALIDLEIGTAAGEQVMFLLALGIPLAALFLGMSCVAKNAQLPLQIDAALLGLVTTTAALNLSPGVMTSGLNILTVTAFFTIAFLLERRVLLLLSAFTAVCTTVYHIRIVLNSFDFNLWITLGLAGVTTIVAASLIERHFSKIMQQLTTMRAALVKWQN
jgi:hypothetical protein